MAWILVGMAFSGWIATLAGWYTTEIGRQPWMVTGVLTTSQAASDVAVGMIASTFIAYLVVYAGLIIAYIATLMYVSDKAARQSSGAQSDKGYQPGFSSSPAE